ncbi:alpha-ketoglutarate-dependent dioxygenase AlkB [Mucilaginibacter sp. Mucisp84]|uniref:alpha-ketoglutarate-dependent dioxygenase AlkB family protein n=1 Tax=Mucilaginibacter sp. Mucisp84 TaxID=3243058 RepID=UPI0039A66A29
MENQLDFFNMPGSIPRAMEGLLDFKASLFDRTDSSRLFQYLKDEIQWKQETLVLYGKRVLTPRLTAWYGDEGIAYRYSGASFISLPWTSTLLEIKAKAEAFACTRFNSVLLNLYRDGNDSMSWHSDDEKELGTNPLIASVNFGEERRFDFKKKENPKIKHSIMLNNGSILVMKGDIQHNWQHQIAKSMKAKGTRINLTFRLVNHNGK